MFPCYYKVCSIQNWPNLVNMTKFGENIQVPTFQAEGISPYDGPVAATIWLEMSKLGHFWPFWPEMAKIVNC